VNGAPADFSSWHPKLQRMYRYWQKARPAPDLLPGRQHIDPLDIPDLLPGIWLLDVLREPIRLRYRLVGTRIVEAIGREVTGQWLEEAHPHVLTIPGYAERYRTVVTSGVPSHRRGQAITWQHEDYREIENVLFPLAADGKTVDVLMVLTVIYWLDGSTD
jgi:hypothetical protein